MKRRVRLSDDAEADIDAAVKWYDERSTRAGTAFLIQVNRSLDRIGEHAERYAKVRGDVRRVAVDGFPYSVYYRIAGDVVDAFVVVHNHRDPINWQSRI